MAKVKEEVKSGLVEQAVTESAPVAKPAPVVEQTEEAPAPCGNTTRGFRQ
jgi:hypothetical protein